MAVMYCPCCDNVYTGKDKVKLEERVTEHVQAQHPDYTNPEWTGTE